MESAAWRRTASRGHQRRTHPTANGHQRRMRRNASSRWPSGARRRTVSCFQPQSPPSACSCCNSIRSMPRSRRTTHRMRLHHRRRRWPSLFQPAAVATTVLKLPLGSTLTYSLFDSTTRWWNHWNTNSLRANARAASCCTILWKWIYIAGRQYGSCTMGTYASPKQIALRPSECWNRQCWRW